MLIWIASDNTKGRELEVPSCSVLEAAQLYGRAESGEIVEVIEPEMGAVVAAAYWDSRYRKYREHPYI